MNYNAAPPTRKHAVQKRSEASAQKLIARYLRRARTTAALRPDVEISPAGITPRTHGSDLGLGLKGLVDFEAGLRGERIAPAPDDEMSLAGEAVGTTAVADTAMAARTDGPSAAVEEWMDKGEFERLQDESFGDIEGGAEGTKEGGEIRSRAVLRNGELKKKKRKGNGDDEGDGESRKKRRKKDAHEDGGGEADAETEQMPLDRDARKAAKKARRKDDRRAMASKNDAAE